MHTRALLLCPFMLWLASNRAAHYKYDRVDFAMRHLASMLWTCCGPCVRPIRFAGSPESTWKIDSRAGLQLPAAQVLKRGTLLPSEPLRATRSHCMAGPWNERTSVQRLQARRPTISEHTKKKIFLLLVHVFMCGSRALAGGYGCAGLSL